MTTKPKRLGKGLGALIKNPATVEAPREPVQRVPVKTETTQVSGDVPRETSTQPVPPSKNPLAEEIVSDGSLVHISLDSVRPNASQPRRHFDEEALKQLSDSLRQHGLLQPIVVRAVPSLAQIGSSGQVAATGGRGGGSGGGVRYELIAGERRWRAAKMAGLTTIAAVVRETDDRGSAELALIENLQREDLNVVERASALRELCERFGLTHGQAAERVGQDRSSVTNLLRLLELDEKTLGLLATGQLSMGHGRALLSVRDEAAREQLAVAAAQEQWSVRELERRCKFPDKLAGKSTANSPSKPTNAVIDLERRLGEQLGTKVMIKTDRTGKRGVMSLTFYGLEHFESLLNKLGLDDRAM